MAGWGGPRAGSIGSRRADASDRGPPGGLRISGVTIGAGAGGEEPDLSPRELAVNFTDTKGILPGQLEQSIEEFVSY